MRSIALRLALADLRHARIATACQIVGLTSLLVPLLILFGIKNGVIADRTATLLSNPEDLRINISRPDQFTTNFIDTLNASPDVRFAGPHPRQLAVLADMAIPVNGGAFVDRVTILATGQGDPYLTNEILPPTVGEVVVTASLAAALREVVPGDLVELLLPARDTQPNGAYMTLRVSGVLPAGTWGRTGALMHPQDVFLLQDWGDGLVKAEALDPMRETRPPIARFPLLRLYATNVDAAFRLVENLTAQGYAPRASLDKARALVSLRTALDTGFLTVATVGLFGVSTTFAASLWSAITRNRRPISLLRLGGLNRRTAVLLPVTQALIIGLAGWITSLAIYGALTGLLDFALADIFGVSQSLAQLRWPEIVASGLATLAVSGIAALFAAIAITRITPEEGFLDVP